MLRKFQILITLLCILTSTTAQGRMFSEIKGLSEGTLQAALVLDSLRHLNLSHEEKVQMKNDALELIEMAADSSDPAACHLLGLIYYEESPRYSSFHDVLLDRWSSWHYDPAWESPTETTSYSVEDGLFDDPLYSTDYSSIKTPLSYTDYCLENAISYFQYAAECGYTEAMYNLGQIYASDHNFDRILSEKYYRQAALNGSTEACAALGAEYFFGGNLFDYNFESAATWLAKALELGDTSHRTCLCLGYCYEKGYGVPQDIIKATEVYSKASHMWEIADMLGNSIGNFSIPFRLGILYYSSDEVRDYDKAFKYLKWIGEQNIREVGDIRGFALRCLSACYRFGRGTAIDHEKADYYLKMAGDFGNIDAQQALKYI